jgi:DNA-binding transcriptional MerR regulator
MGKSNLLTIGQLAAQSGLSRSTLIYYDRKGLLSPSGRSETNYRLYSNKDLEKLNLILTHRNGGLSLKEIAAILDSRSVKSTAILSNRLKLLNLDIQKLRQQQQTIVKIIGRSSLIRSVRIMDKARWTELLSVTGLSEADMKRWHVEFE